MRKTQTDYTSSREKILAEGIREVATELRLVNVEDYIAYIRVEQFANLAQLVNSSTELFFKPGTLRFGFSGDAELSWATQPVISLDMEFHHLDVAAYFTLKLDKSDFGVDIQYITFKPSAGDPDLNTGRFELALRDARLVPVHEAAPVMATT